LPCTPDDCPESAKATDCENTTPKDLAIAFDIPQNPALLALMKYPEKTCHQVKKTLPNVRGS
jgi:hypothetical protein